VRILIVIFLSLLALILQATLFHYLRFWGVLPDLVLILVVCFALLKGSAQGAVVGFFAGLLEDIFLGKILGINAISKMLVAYLVGLTEEKVFKANPWVAVVALLVATMMDNFCTILLYKIFFALPNLDFQAFNRVLWPLLFYNMLLAPFIYWKLYSWLIKTKHY